MAYTAISRLCATNVTPQTASVFVYASAAICFLGASAGGVLTMLGHHLLDGIEVGERWWPRTRDTFLSPENSKS
ncbi:hypothetical protein EQZ23_06460 [Sphingomonas sp. UV9]|uniref:hypothetical protein n=1 Tax=Sphingomonas sp. UV9 TaxID=1851410 RepID=UPI000FFB9D5E|nr:hypothetical protein [Sphingomonas sp. UV9]RXD04795.1 hypothetical protein EQZ23_06460 [Sphingomonas sp. UV9]